MRFTIQGDLAGVTSMIGISDDGFWGDGPLGDYVQQQARVGSTLEPPSPWAPTQITTDDPFALYVAAVCFCGPNNVKIIDGAELVPKLDPTVVV